MSRLCTALLLCLLASSVHSAEKAAIDAQVSETLSQFRIDSPVAAQLLDRAAGVLVFPDVLEMGFGVGGQYGEGALLIGGEPQAYYVIAGASFGLQLGAQSKAELILFMTEAALQGFQSSQGWQAGIHGSIAVLARGRELKFDSIASQKPVIGFIYANRGLMYNLSLEGNKITRIKR